MFFHALLPRVLEAGRTDDVQRARWAVEDAWRNPLVMKRWIAFARLLTAAQCEAAGGARRRQRAWRTQRVEQIDTAAATEGWNLETRGYVPHAVVARGAAAPPGGAAAVNRRSPLRWLPSPGRSPADPSVITRIQSID